MGARTSGPRRAALTSLRADGNFPHPRPRTPPPISAHRRFSESFDIARRARRRMSPAHELHAPVVMLDNRGAAIHPVAAVYIGHAIDALDRRRMYVAADDPVEAKLPGIVHDRIFEIADEAHRAQHVALGVIRQRPMAAHAELAAD